MYLKSCYLGPVPKIDMNVFLFAIVEFKLEAENKIIFKFYDPENLHFSEYWNLEVAFHQQHGSRWLKGE